MCGSRKFPVEYLGRDDLTVLTQDAHRITGLPLVMNVDAEEVDEILGC